ncbi:MAG: hypothetical protein ACO2ZM_03620 [Francisellaceae bacterium]
MRRFLSIGSEQTIHLPEVILFNGGVSYCEAICKRISSLVSNWKGEMIDTLMSPSVSLAVAKGAVSFQHYREKQRAVVAHAPFSYALMIDDKTHSGVCLLNQGAKVGQSFSLIDTFHLKTGQQVRFPLYYSAFSVLKVGDRFCFDQNWHKLYELVLTPDRDAEICEIELTSRLDEVGVLSLKMNDGQRQVLALDFALNDKSKSTEKQKRVDSVSVDSYVVDGIKPFLHAYFVANTLKTPGFKQQIKRYLAQHQISKANELRQLFDPFFELKNRRKRSPDHEATWWHYIGFILRPGIGVNGDGRRVNQLIELYAEKLQYPKDSQAQNQFWAAWRRVSLGLSPEHQERIYDDIKAVTSSAKSSNRASTMAKSEKQRLLFSLDRLPVSIRNAWFQYYSERLCRRPADVELMQAIARLGARRLPEPSSLPVDIKLVEQSIVHFLQLDITKNAVLSFERMLTLIAMKNSVLDNNLDLILFDQVRQRIKHRRYQIMLTGNTENVVRELINEDLPLGLQLFKDF